MRVSQRVTPQLKSSQPSRFTGQRILLMDNEAVLLQAVSQLLQSWHCDVKAVSSPSEALAAVQQGFKPDLMLFDYHLDQGATGVEVAVQLAEHFGISSPVVINSADQSADIRQHALNAGFHFMLKPLKEVSLKRLLQRLLN
jgi:CheY-like chemotaxis protein